MPQWIAELLKGRFLGHPVHAMLVHFPSAFLPTALMFDIIAILLENPFYAEMAFYLLGFGVMMGIAAACFGSLDYFRLSAKSKAWKTASIHGLLNILWLMVFGTLFGISAMDYPNIQMASVTQLIVTFIAVIGLLVSNFLGGELVFHYHIGSVSDKDTTAD